MPALFESPGMAVIAGGQDHAAALPPGDLGKGDAVLLAGLGHVDQRDIVIVLVELFFHRVPGRDGSEEKSLFIKELAQQYGNVVVIFDDQHLANARHPIPLKMLGAITATAFTPQPALLRGGRRPAGAATSPHRRRRVASVRRDARARQSARDRAPESRRRRQSSTADG